MKAAVLCDFDGTAVLQNVSVAILERFAQGDWQAYDRAWEQGTVRPEEVSPRQFALVKASCEEIEAYARSQAELRPGFREMAAFCQRRLIPLVIVTSGLTFYVKAALEQAGLGSLPVSGDGADFAQQSIVVVPGPRLAGCPNGGACKCATLQHYRDRGYTVAFVGDGSRDFCVSRKADILFARRKLRDYAEAQGLEYSTYDDFFQVMRRLEEWLDTEGREAPLPTQRPSQGL
ncbi:MAG: HAD-IB family phosphatase [Chloroflexi bacterium]|nr:HAD-IB family phosphatase [Chloroflexota bacterium]